MDRGKKITRHSKSPSSKNARKDVGLSKDELDQVHAEYQAAGSNATPAARRSSTGAFKLERTEYSQMKDLATRDPKRFVTLKSDDLRKSNPHMPKTSIRALMAHRTRILKAAGVG